MPIGSDFLRANSEQQINLCKEAPEQDSTDKSFCYEKIFAELYLAGKYIWVLSYLPHIYIKEKYFSPPVEEFNCVEYRKKKKKIHCEKALSPFQSKCMFQNTSAGQTENTKTKDD